MQWALATFATVRHEQLFLSATFWGCIRFAAMAQQPGYLLHLADSLPTAKNVCLAVTPASLTFNNGALYAGTVSLLVQPSPVVYATAWADGLLLNQPNKQLHRNSLWGAAVAVRVFQTDKLLNVKLRAGPVAEERELTQWKSGFINLSLLQNSQYLLVADSSNLGYGYSAQCVGAGFNWRYQSHARYALKSQGGRFSTYRAEYHFFAEILMAAKLKSEHPANSIYLPWMDQITYQRAGLRAGATLSQAVSNQLCYTIGIQAGRLPFALYRPGGAAFVSFQAGASWFFQ